MSVSYDKFRDAVKVAALEVLKRDGKEVELIFPMDIHGRIQCQGVNFIRPGNEASVAVVQKIRETDPRGQIMGAASHVVGILADLQEQEGYWGSYEKAPFVAEIRVAVRSTPRAPPLKLRTLCS